MLQLSTDCGTIQHVRDFASILGIVYPETITNTALFDLVLQEGFQDEAGTSGLIMDDSGIVYSAEGKAAVLMSSEASQ